MLPELTIGILTYNRFEDIQRTVRSLRENLIYPAEKLKWIISDDCSPDDYLYRLSAEPLFADMDVTFISTPKNAGWGASANNLLSSVETPYVYLTEDDWMLCIKLDLRAGIGLLETRQDVGMVRYGGTAGDMEYTYHQRETDVSAYTDVNIHATDYAVGGKLTYLVIDVDSPAHYVYSGRPQLAKLRWYYDMGTFPEGLKVGDTEDAMCHKVKHFLRAYPNTHEIAILPDFVNMKYRHIGANSYQNKAVV